MNVHSSLKVRRREWVWTAYGFQCGINNVMELDNGGGCHFVTILKPTELGTLKIKTKLKMSHSFHR